MASNKLASLRIGICDDSPSDISFLRSMLKDYFSEHELEAKIESFTEAGAFLKCFTPGVFHIIFLDIYIPVTSGMRIAESIRDQDENCALIFTTSSPDHAFESYGVHASGYLLKPYTADQLAECLEWVFSEMAESLQALEIISEREKVNIPYRDILYIEVYGRTSIIHTQNRDFSTNRSLKELKDYLGDSFLQCHRSYIVNMEHIQKPSGTSFILPGKKSIPITVDNASKIKQSFYEWSFRHTWESR